MTRILLVAIHLRCYMHPQERVLLLVVRAVQVRRYHPRRANSPRQGQLLRGPHSRLLANQVIFSLIHFRPLLTTLLLQPVVVLQILPILIQRYLQRSRFILFEFYDCFQCCHRTFLTVYGYIPASCTFPIDRTILACDASSFPDFLSVCTYTGYFHNHFHCSTT